MESVLPKIVSPRTEAEDPNRDVPKTDNEEPQRPSPRIDNALPSNAQSKTLAHDPIRAIP
jgi:hypothetical protein